MTRTFHHPALDDITIDGILYALSDPSRRNIVAKLLGTTGMSCSKACEDMPPSTISFHHKVLRDSGLIRSEKKGVEVQNSLRKAELEKRFPGLLRTIIQYHNSSRQKG